MVKKYGELENVWYCSPTDKEMFRLPDGIWIMWAFFQDARDAQAVSIKVLQLHSAEQLLSQILGVER